MLSRESRPSLLLTLLSIGLVGGALLACGAPKTHYYALKVNRPKASATTPLMTKSLAVERFRGERAYDQERLIYRDQDNRVGFYEYHRWLSSPLELATRAATSQLLAAGYFSSVSAYRDAPQAEYLLRGQVINFEEVDKATGVFGLVRLEVSLIDNQSRRPVWSGYGEAELPVEVRDVAGVARTLDAALAESTRQILASLGEYLKQNPGE